MSAAGAAGPHRDLQHEPRHEQEEGAERSARHIRFQCAASEDDSEATEAEARLL